MPDGVWSASVRVYGVLLAVYTLRSGVVCICTLNIVDLYLDLYVDCYVALYVGE